MNLTHRNIEHNKNVHDSVAKVYNKSHSEIYNSIEQERLYQVISDLISLVEVNEDMQILDFGAGTGNLTLKFLEKKCKVTACDVSAKSLLKLQVEANNSTSLKTVVLENQKLPFNSNSFDIVCTYSVLHHIPDYLESVKEMVRVCKPNGIVYIDHERNNNFWFPSEKLKVWQKISKESYLDQFIRVFSTREIFTISFIKSVFIRLFINKRYIREGDLHVWSDDHIEWTKLCDLVRSIDCEIEKEQDYLLFSRKVTLNVYNDFKVDCSDTKYVFIRKKK